MKKLPSIDAFYRALIRLLSSSDMDVVLYALVALSALVINDPLEAKLFSSSNILHILRLSFNLLLLNVSSASSRFNAARLLSELLLSANVMTALRAFPAVRDSLRSSMLLLGSDDRRLHLPITKLLRTLLDDVELGKVLTFFLLWPG